MHLIVLWVKEQLQVGICTKWTDSHDSSARWCIGPASCLTVSTQCKKRFAWPAFLKPSWMQLESSNHLGWERPSQSPSPTTNMIYWVHGAILIAGSRTRRLAARNSPPNKFLQRRLSFLHCGKVPFKRIECFLPTQKFMVNANAQLILPKLPPLAIPSTKFTLAICPLSTGLLCQPRNCYSFSSKIPDKQIADFSVKYALLGQDFYSQKKPFHHWFDFCITQADSLPRFHSCSG